MIPSLMIYSGRSLAKEVFLGFSKAKKDFGVFLLKIKILCALNQSEQVK